VRAGGRRRHDLPGEGAADRDNDQLPVSGADREGTGVRLLKDAQDVGDRLAVTWCGPAPADDDPLADIGGREPDLQPEAHAVTSPRAGPLARPGRMAAMSTGAQLAGRPS
jgi:hypothetical protein